MVVGIVRSPLRLVNAGLAPTGETLTTDPHTTSNTHAKVTITKNTATKTVNKPAATAKDVSERGLEFIARFEGCVLHAYDDAGPGHGNATVGIGHLLHLGPCTAADIQKYRTFTYSEAIQLLHQDAQRFVPAVRAIGVPLTQTEFDALTCFAFNLGAGALAGNITHYLHAGNKQAAMQTLQEYTHAGGVVLPGLVRRRVAEAHLFLNGVYQ